MESISVWSIIVFADRCTLKRIEIKSPDVRIVNRYSVAAVISSIFNQSSNVVLNDYEIVELYDKLYPYSQVDVSIKIKHIDKIQDGIYSPTVSHQIRSNEYTETVQPVEIANTELSAMDSISNAKIESKVEMEAQPVDLSTQYSSHILKNPKCPKCGSDLVLRTATRGANIGKQFYGCSNYPRCRYLQNLTQE